MKKKENMLSEQDYATQLRLSQNSPIATADFVPIRVKNGRKEFLLAKRTEVPYRGEYFVAGGKIIGNESVEEAVRRNVKRELGMITHSPVFVCHLPVKNPPKMGIPWLSLWHFHVVPIVEGSEIQLNKENSRAMWFSSISKRWPLPVRQALLKAGFSYRQ